MWKGHSHHRIAFGHVSGDTKYMWYGWKIEGPIQYHRDYEYWGPGPYIILQLDDESATDLGMKELAVSTKAIRTEVMEWSSKYHVKYVRN